MLKEPKHYWAIRKGLRWTLSPKARGFLVSATEKGIIIDVITALSLKPTKIERDARRYCEEWEVVDLGANHVVAKQRLQVLKRSAADEKKTRRILATDAEKRMADYIAGVDEERGQERNKIISKLEVKHSDGDHTRNVAERVKRWVKLSAKAEALRVWSAHPDLPIDARLARVAAEVDDLRRIALSCEEISLARGYDKVVGYVERRQRVRTRQSQIMAERADW